MRTRTPKPSVLDVLDVQEENRFHVRQTSHQDVMNVSSRRQPMNVSAQRHGYRNSLVASEPADGTGDNLVNTGEEMLEDED